MAVVLLLLGKILPIYALIALGWYAGRYLGTKREMLAKLLLFIIVPAVSFYGAAVTPLSGAVLSLPLVFFGVCATLCLLSYALARRLWKDTTANILAYACGTGNNGYFGIPLVIALFSEEAFGIAVVAGMGFLLYEVTIGFVIVARGTMSYGDSIRRLLRYPLIYAFFIGILWNLLHIPVPVPLGELLLNFRGAYAVFGMMLVGLGLSSIRTLFVDVRFLAVSLVCKFLLWPILMGAFVVLDRSFLHLYAESVHQVMLTLSIVPLAANTVVYATELGTHPEKAASAVFVSTIVALLYIPIVVAVFL
jgi:malate permease and related proteins